MLSLGPNRRRCGVCGRRGARLSSSRRCGALLIRCRIRCRVLLVDSRSRRAVACIRGVFFRDAGVGNEGGLWDRMSGAMGKMSHDKRRGSRLVTHWPGLPLPGSPLVYFLPSSPPSSDDEDAHIPFGKRRGRSRWQLAWFCALTFGPTSLVRGEGHYVGGIPSL